VCSQRAYRHEPCPSTATQTVDAGMFRRCGMAHLCAEGTHTASHVRRSFSRTLRSLTTSCCRMQSDQAGAGALCNPPKASSQSNHNSFPVEFDKWGYKFYDDDGRTSLDRYYYGLETTLPAIGASLCQKDWKFWKITHGNYRTTNPHINGQTYPAPTDGHQQKRVRSPCIILFLETC
jgi:hypothetical protein